jgi:hypothetical protein
VAVETRLPVGDLLDLDEDMLLTLVEVHNERWTRMEHLLADLIEVVDSGNVVREAVNSKKGTKPRKRLEVPRPRTKDPVPAKKSPREGFRKLMQMGGGARGG